MAGRFNAALPEFARWWSPLGSQFWSNPSAWPRDTSDWVFLARAFQKVGSAMFGQHWTGEETVAKSELDSDPGPVARRSVVLMEMIQRLQTGDFESGIRALKGGEIVSIDPTWWNTEPARARLRFIGCQLDQDAPFDGAVVGKRNSWIYVSKRTLTNFADKQPFRPRINQQFEGHVSPYMNLMLAVAKEMSIKPDNQPKKEEVITKLNEVAARDFGEELPDKLSNNLLKAMATLMRETESQKGRAKKN
jgi:hypothetical protein